MKRMISPRFGDIVWKDLEFFGEKGAMWGSLLSQNAPDRAKATARVHAEAPRNQTKSRNGARGYVRREWLKAKREANNAKLHSYAVQDT